MTPFFFTQMRRRVGLCLVTVLAGLVFALALCLVHRSAKQMTRQIEAVYDNLEVRCTVTNLTGTQSDGLDLPDWVLGVFDQALAGKNHTSDLSLSEYVKDVHSRCSVVCTPVQSETHYTLSGINDLDADSALQQSAGCMIWWRDGYDEEIFQGSEMFLLLPVELEEQLSDEDGRIVLKVGGGDNPIMVSFRVAGVYSGGAGRLYCPWIVGRDLCVRANGYLRLDSVSATIKDNRRIDEFWQTQASRCFVKPSKDGQPVPWEESPIYQTYPYALAVYDDTLVKTVEQLQQNRQLLQIVSGLILAASFGVSAVYSFLALRHRRRELKLQHILGQKPAGILCCALLEHGILSLIGAAMGVGIFCAAYRDTPDLTAVTVFCFVSLGGTALSYLLTMRKAFLETSLGRE